MSGGAMPGTLGACGGSCCDSHGCGWGRAQTAEIARLAQERDEARKFGEMAVEKYNSSRVLRCAFCDQEYPPGTPATQHEALTAHVRVCESHPLRAEIVRHKEALAVMTAAARVSDAALQSVQQAYETTPAGELRGAVGAILDGLGCAALAGGGQ